jgi:hypothetical protein
MVTKILLWLLAMGIFWDVSWRLWPARVFALPHELPALRRQFKRRAIALVSIAIIAMALGMLIHIKYA